MNAVPPAVPALNASRLLYIGTGSLTVTHMPFWLNWLSIAYPDLKLRLVVTRSAERFVTRAALAPLAGGGEVLLDVWPERPAPTALHVELAEWAEVVLVYPATLHYLARLAVGLADTPSLLAVQCTTAPVVVAPTLPPGAAASPVYRRHVAALAERPNVRVVPPVPAVSATTGRPDAAAAPPLPDLIAAAEELRARLAVTA